MCTLKFRNDYLYQWGGLGQNRGVYRYDLREQAWEHLETRDNSEPNNISYSGSVLLDDEWIFLPGWDETDGKNTDNIWRVEIKPSSSDIPKWNEIPRVPSDDYYEAV